jgi:IclR family KDG regulon transcriptional repressor
MQRAAQPRVRVRVLQKTLDILETIREKQPGVRLADLARAVQMPKPTVYRIVTTLEARGYLDRSEDGNYRMGKKLFELQRDGSLEKNLIRIAEPVMQQLAGFCEETVNLAVLDAGDVLIINTIDSPRAVRMSSKIGMRVPVHSTALGKVMLAALDDKEILRLIRLKGLRRVTPNTMATRADVLAEVRRVRRQKFAVDNQENEVGGRCVATPVVGSEGRVVAALSISAPMHRMDLARIRSLAGKLTEACTAIAGGLRR